MDHEGFSFLFKNGYDRKEDVKTQIKLLGEKYDSIDGVNLSKKDTLDALSLLYCGEHIDSGSNVSLANLKNEEISNLIDGLQDFTINNGLKFNNPGEYSLKTQYASYSIY